MSSLEDTTAPVRKIKLSSLKANREKEREGDWITASDLDAGIRWFVRSTNYAPFKIERDALTAKLARKYEDKTVPDDVIAEMSGKLAVKHLLLGWSGLVSDDDAEILYSAEVAGEILTDEAYRAVRNSVYFAATKVGRFEIEAVGDLSKN